MSMATWLLRRTSSLNVRDISQWSYSLRPSGDSLPPQRHPAFPRLITFRVVVIRTPRCHLYQQAAIIADNRVAFGRWPVVNLVSQNRPECGLARFSTLPIALKLDGFESQT
jgi:hypothetical protein